jgi:hypothetical protein
MDSRLLRRCCFLLGEREDFAMKNLKERSKEILGNRNNKSDVEIKRGNSQIVVYDFIPTAGFIKICSEHDDLTLFSTSSKKENTTRHEDEKNNNSSNNNTNHLIVNVN